MMISERCDATTIGRGRPIRSLLRLGRALAGSGFLVLAFAVPVIGAFAPVPPFMYTLMCVFPEKDGWFVEPPMRVSDRTPSDLHPLFDAYRVIVPDVDAVERAVARLMAAAPDLPIRKVTRFDRKPDWPGLPGFRGIWCETENAADTGFIILTVNQNRFLFWMRDQFIPALDSAEAVPKPRDAYARDVSRYLAGVDAGVPEDDPPQSAARVLPEWLDLYATSAADSTGPAGGDSMPAHEEVEIRAWGLHDLVQFVPTALGIGHMIEAAPDTLWPDSQVRAIQQRYRDYFAAGHTLRSINTLTRTGFDTLPSRTAFDFAVDSHGRVRVIKSATELPGDSTGGRSRGAEGHHDLLFFGEPLLSAGRFVLGPVTHESRVIEHVDARAEAYFCHPHAPAEPGNTVRCSDRSLETLGHFFAALKLLGVQIKQVTISKF